MNATANTSLNGRFAYQQALSLIADDLAQVEVVLATELRSEAPYVDELLAYIGQLGGKRLRPSLLLLSGLAVGKITAEHHTLAAVMEMVHTATLVHDDILDDARTRRHRMSVNRRWDTKSAVLAGDFLFTHAFYLSSTLPNNFASRAIGRATNRVCEGELNQVGHCGNLDLNENDYLDLISAKTADLCACCCLLGAHYAGGTAEMIGSLEAYGRDLGIAFQIADDLLDWEGCESQTGKSLGTDLEERKLTLPLIHLLGVLEPKDRHEVRQLLASENSADQLRVALLPLLRRHGSFDYARHQAVSYVSGARGYLAHLAPSPARDALDMLAELAVARCG